MGQAVPQHVVPPAQHVPPQLATGPAGQVQLRFVQVAVGGHVVSHRPQLCSSVAGSTQAPLHSIWPVGQTHWLDWQT